MAEPRRTGRLGATWPPAAAGWVLIALLGAGVALRLVAIVSWWPTTRTIDDGYQVFAESNPFADPLHPAGYGLLLGALGAVTREVAAPVLLQHVAGIASALLLFAATRRVTGSAWAALLPAAILLLNPDQIFLEHAIMSETSGVLVTSAGLYTAVRTLDEPAPWWRWPLAAGALLALAVTIRTAGLLVIPVVILALLLARPGPLVSWPGRWGAPVVAAGTAAAILFIYATANASFGERFGVTPSPGWYLYGRVAQFADCKRFTPPAGTEVLCDSRPSYERPGAGWYLFNREAPAPRLTGGFGAQDDLVGEWANRALRAQPLDFAGMAWEYLRGYWAPSLRPERPDSGGNLDPQLDFTFENPYAAPIIEARLKSFYDDFTVDPYEPGLEFLHDWQRLGRFGGTLLSITTLLTLLGLVVGMRRSRVGVLLFGVGGLALIVAPALSVDFTGRYTVPMAGPLVAAAAITLTELWRRLASRRDSRLPRSPMSPVRARNLTL
jgi:hypothetical protein